MKVIVKMDEEYPVYARVFEDEEKALAFFRKEVNSIEGALGDEGVSEDALLIYFSNKGYTNGLTHLICMDAEDQEE
jgi:hypothetical protein